jgi:hypothetical protein
LVSSFERIGLVLICTAAAAVSAVVVLSFDRASQAPASPIAAVSLDPQSADQILPPASSDAASIKHQGRLPVAEDAREEMVPVATALLDGDDAGTPAVERVSLATDAAASENPDDISDDAAQWSAKVIAPPQPALPRAAAIDLQLKVLPPVIATPHETAPHQGAPHPAPQVGEPSLTAPKRIYTLDERLAEISPAAKQRLAAKLAAANFSGPPADVGLVAIKDEKQLELHVKSASGEWQFVHRYPVLAASGAPGPKLKQGDKQVPEGVYGITLLNPNSKYHVSMRVDYPNAFDREMAAKDGRKDLGGDIMIHGKAVSIGCLAIGDEAAEELFVLASQVGLKKIKLVIAPTDMRKSGLPAIAAGQPKWLPKLYGEVATAMAPFKAPSTGLLSLLGL